MEVRAARDHLTGFVKLAHHQNDFVSYFGYGGAWQADSRSC